MSESPSRLRFSTPIVIAVFAVSAVTGVLLFFHLGERLIKELHEWMGVVFVVAALLHAVRNGRALLLHARRPTLWIAAALVVATAAAFIVPALAAREGGNEGTRQLVQAVMRAPLEQVAPIVATTAPELTERLTAAGFTVAGPSASLSDIARASGRSPQELAKVVVAGLPAPPERR